VIGDNVRTQARFHTERGHFVQHYAGAIDPSDMLIKHVKSNECHKPCKMDVQQQASLVETLWRIANRFIGNDQELTDA